MINAELVRFKLFIGGPQYGIIRVDNKVVCLTLELPYLNNQHNVSSIPIGTYVCEQVLDRRLSSGLLLPITFEVQDVPQRSGILFHPGNSVRDSHGCILCGLALGPDNTLLQSTAGFKEFISTFKDEQEFELWIREI